MRILFVVAFLDALLTAAIQPAPVLAQTIQLRRGGIAREISANGIAAPRWNPAERRSYLGELTSLLESVAAAPHLDSVVVYLADALSMPAVSPQSLAARRVALEALGRPAVRVRIGETLERAQASKSESTPESTPEPTPAAESESSEESRLATALQNVWARIDSFAPTERRRLLSAVAGLKRRLYGGPLDKERVLSVLEGYFRDFEGESGIAPNPQSTTSGAPTSSEILARARTRGVPFSTIAAAVQKADHREDLRDRFNSLGLIKPGEYRDLGDIDADLRFRNAANMLWFHASPGSDSQFNDDTPGIASVVVEAGGVQFHIHAMRHDVGLGRSAWRPHGAPVRRLVQRLKNERLPLYWEQNLAGHHGFGYGRETLDQEIRTGNPALIRDLPPGARPRVTYLALRRSALAIALGLSLYTAFQVPATFQAPARTLPWITSFILAAANYALWDLRIFYRLGSWNLARAATSLGYPDLAAFLRGKARILHGWRTRVEEFGRIYLPMPIGADLGPAPSEDAAQTINQSRAAAEAIYEEALARGYKEVHVLRGVEHARQMAWDFAQIPQRNGTKGPNWNRTKD